MTRKVAASLLVMAMIAVLSIAYLLQSGLDLALGDRKKASVVVDDSAGILPGSRMLMRGIDIGRVSAVSNVREGVRIDVEYRTDIRLPEGSRFRVDNLSALGEAYVAVFPVANNGRYLADGATVPPRDVLDRTSFKELSARLTTLLKQVDSKQVRQIFAELDAGLPAGLETLGDLNRVGTLLASEFTQQADRLVTLLKTLQPLLMRSGVVPPALAAATPMLHTFGVNWQDIFRAQAEGVDEVRKYRNSTVADAILTGTSPMLTEIQKFLDKSSKDLQTIGVNLMPAVSAGAAAMRTVNLGQVMDAVLSATQPSGAITLRTPAPPK